MSDITKQSLSELVKNIKDKKLSSEDSFLTLIFLTNSESDCFVISDIIQLPLEQQNNPHYLGVNFLLSDFEYLCF